MPTVPKGDRAAHTFRPDIEVSELLKAKVAAARVSSLSQYVADLLAIHVGRPDLARELNSHEEVLPLAI